MFPTLFICILFFLLNLLELLSANESDFLNDQSDNDGSDSGSAGKCACLFALKNLLFALTDWLVVSVAWVLFVLFQYELSQL